LKRGDRDGTKKHSFVNASYDREMATTRRSQAERSATTREALLDATIASLVEDGYAGTTTARVAERAGVSRGAHLHHFQTRQALVAAAIEQLTLRRTEELVAAAEDLPPGPEGIAAGLDFIWSNYTGPLFQAALELWVHARTDADLREHLVPVERSLDRQMADLARTLFGDLADRDDFDRRLDMAAATIRGVALLDTLQPGQGRGAKQWGYCREELIKLFADAR
jgi:AcrR family transcriptional regulator